MDAYGDDAFDVQCEWLPRCTRGVGLKMTLGADLRWGRSAQRAWAWEAVSVLAEVDRASDAAGGVQRTCAAGDTQLTPCTAGPLPFIEPCSGWMR